MKKLIVAILAIIIIITIGNRNTTQEIIIPNESIRIRVIANSNSKEDQSLKLKVKKSVQSQLSNMLKDATNIEEVRKILKENLQDVEYTVEEVIKNNNTNNKEFSNYNVNFGYNYFPQKTYKGVKYDEGKYESIVITLGQAKGENWWCVLFPPLCLIEEDNEDVEEVEYKSFIKEIIAKYF